MKRKSIDYRCSDGHMLRIHAVADGPGFVVRVWSLRLGGRPWEMYVELGRPIDGIQTAAFRSYSDRYPSLDEIQAACGVHLFGLPPRSAARRACERRWSDGHGRCYATPRMDLERGGWVMVGDEGDDFGLIDLSEMTATRPGEDRSRPCTTSPPP